ncbi:MAG: hypothetical protein CYPHOPRED_005032 [Cyphobasidiales sp. Tagirdzhanova-0007]|nr:MAG: hypothetical protein CYPHOPRED_005032 [Cyphobasidiales sp. Tagirdzhanova-0007]
MSVRPTSKEGSLVKIPASNQCYSDGTTEASLDEAELPITQSRRRLFTPAIVNQRRFGKDGTFSSVPDDWKCVRPLSANGLVGDQYDRRSTYSTSDAGHPRNLKTTDQHDKDSDSDDSHSGDEYAQYNKFRVTRQRSQLLHKECTPSLEKSPLQLFLNLFRLPALTAVQRGILKCSIAYLLASLFTFLPVLSDLFASPFDLEGPVSGAHVIATVATYYNPAKTLGAMIEADLFMLWASAFALVTAFGSMATAVLLNKVASQTLSHIVIVVFWLSGAMGLVAWMKVKVSNTQFGSACSMVALIISSVICKEGSVHMGVFQVDTISQTFATVILGTVISNIVCFLVWKGSATSKLQGDINKTLESFATLLDLLSRSFLSEDTLVSEDTLKKAIDAHRSSFTALQISLEAAKLELWDNRIQQTQRAYDKVVGSMNRLAQHLNGLRSAESMRRDLDAYRVAQISELHKDSKLYKDECGENIDTAPSPEDIMSTLREQTKSRQVLRDVRASFIQSRAGEKKSAAVRASDVEAGTQLEPEGLRKMKNELEQALVAHKSAHTKAIKRLYRHYPSNLDDERDFLRMAAKSENGTGPNEEVFLIYFFCFNLEEFAKEQAFLIDAFGVIHNEEQVLEEEKQAYQDRFGVAAPLITSIDIFGMFRKQERHLVRTYRWATLRKRLVRLMPFTSDAAAAPFPATDDAAVTSHSAIQDRQEQTLFSKTRRMIWELSVACRKPAVVCEGTAYACEDPTNRDHEDALKTGIGCGILGSFAFYHTTRPIFVKYSGNWAMLSYMVIVSTTVGATNFNAFFRIGGTLAGSATAVATWYVLQAHPVLLCIASFFFSMPCFWLINTKPKFATSGRFVLLSYNLTALYAYNVRDTNYDIEEIAFHRTVSVVAGTIWGVIVTRYVFPSEARKEMRSGLSELLLNAAYFYQCLNEYISRGDGHPSAETDATADDDSPTSEFTPLLAGSADIEKATKRFIKMEMNLQVSLIKLSVLIDHAKHEPRLKGPFPAQPYESVLQASQRLFDALHAMRAVATRPDFRALIRDELILSANSERREVTGNILLFMSLLASDLSLKAPLPPYLPPAEEARKRLITRIGSLPIVQQRAARGTSAFLLYYSYALMEKDLIAQLEKIGSIFQYIFGVMGDTKGTGLGVEAFEALFEDPMKDSVQDSMRGNDGNESSDDEANIGQTGEETRRLSTSR